MAKKKLFDEFGNEVKIPFFKKVWFWLPVIPVVLFLIGISGGDEPAAQTEEPATAETEPEVLIEEEEVVEEPSYDAAALDASKQDPASYDSTITYDMLARTPDDYMYRWIALTGRVIQVMEGDGITQLRIAINDDYDAVALVEYDSSIVDQRILDEDYVTVYGESMGLFTYESTLGGAITIPAMTVFKLDLQPTY